MEKETSRSRQREIDLWKARLFDSLLLSLVFLGKANLDTDDVVHRVDTHKYI